MGIPCNTPSCAVPNLKVDISEVKKDIKELMRQNGTILAIHRDVKYLGESIRQIREDDKDVSNRLLKIEDTGHHREILQEIQTKMTKRGLIAFLSISTGILTLIFLVVQIVVSVYLGKR